MRTDTDIESAIAAHGDAVWRVCLMRMGSRADAQDAFQETFLSYATHGDVAFNDEGHRRAWLIRVATNRCIDMLRAARPTAPLDGDEGQAAPEPVSTEPSYQPESALWEVAQALDRLSPDQREAVYLTVCEGYSAVEAARIMDVPVNTVYSWVARGKEHLREALS